MKHIAHYVDFRVEEWVEDGSTDKTELAEFLKSIQYEDNDFSFIVEIAPDRSHKIIAQSEPDRNIADFFAAATGNFADDIANFTTTAEKMTPEDLVIQLSNYLTTVSSIIQEHGGTLDKYIGDALLACKAAIAIQNALKSKGETWKTRIGIHTGDAIVGNIGSESFMNYSVIGDTVNLASRLEGLNKNYDTQILISENTYEIVKGKLSTKPIDRVTAKSRTEPVQIHTLGDRV